MSVNGSNNFLNIEDANLRVRNGSVHAQGMTIGGAIVSASHGLQSVSDTGNTTSNTLQFTNATTAFKATSNIELTANTAIVVESNVLMDFKTLGQIEFPGSTVEQEYPPRDLYQHDTNIEGHGVFCVSASAEHNTDNQTWEAFGNNATPGNVESVWNSLGAMYVNATGAYTSSTTTSGINGEWIQMKTPYKVKISSFILDSYATSGRRPRDFVLLGSNDGNVWEQMKSVSGQTTGYTMNSPYATSSGGPHHTVNSTKFYTYFRIVITHVQPSGDGLAAVGRLRFFGTPGPTTLDKGSLTLGRSLDVPRVSRYDVDTETPRPEKLVVDFDTTVNSSPTDISGKGNHGTLIGATYSAPDKAFDFSATNNVIYVPSLSPNMTGDIIVSMSCWFKLDNSATRQTIMWMGSDAANADFIDIRVKGGYIGLSMAFDPDTNMLGIKYTDQVLENNRWYHVVGVKSGTGAINSTTTNTMLQLYLDGVKLNTVDGGLTETAGLNIPTDHNFLVVGAANETGSVLPMAGQVSNPKLYNVALEPSEVQKLYRLGRTGRSMVISDTAVGIGKVPEAQLDVRGNLRVGGRGIIETLAPRYYSSMQRGTFHNVSSHIITGFDHYAEGYATPVLGWEVHINFNQHRDTATHVEIDGGYLSTATGTHVAVTEVATRKYDQHNSAFSFYTDKFYIGSDIANAHAAAYAVIRITNSQVPGIPSAIHSGNSSTVRYHLLGHTTYVKPGIGSTLDVAIGQITGGNNARLHGIRVATGADNITGAYTVYTYH